ncbi:hypothetical protein ADL00_22865 [Streptomyces sp. AS58]|uniref:hypothetical protein n=1 Tax=Streptomyces sp. AS58 TaxID=1519489 RepID=UPI0006AEF277|nr:hypothetical protein [Streptomyces sp. AS58]KOV63790.1 hypothetical protein ADL00_22865 [Streptomyces sp. AS58]
MAGRGKHPRTILFVRDADAAVADLRQALAEAGPEERPGLERAVGIAERAARASDADLRARWVRERLAAVGYEGPVDSVKAIKHLREAAPGLGLLEAVQLAKSAAQGAA